MKQLNTTFLFILLISLPQVQSFAKKKELKCDYVDLFIGTAGDNGQVDPAACVPYGMVRVCPDMVPRSHVGYDYNITRISGFSVNRISGIGCSGAGGNIRLKPVSKSIQPEINKSTETATPGYYAVTLNNGVKVELSATNNLAIERFHYPETEKALLTLDVTAGFEKIRECEIKVISDYELQGFIRTGNTCNHGEYKLYYNLTTNEPFNVLSQQEGIAELEFSRNSTSSVEVRIALSPLGYDVAKEENTRYSKKRFSDIRKQAAADWEKLLSRIQINSTDRNDLTLFYTCLYRVFLSPANVTSHDRRYLATDGSIQQADNFTYYSSWSMWDSYRTKFPLITLIDHSTMRNISLSLSKLYKYGKKDWATKYESTPTVRTEHSIAIILDAYKKGIPFDLSDGYEGFKKDMETLQTQRPDQAFETAIDLWSMSEIAKLLGKKEDSMMYAKRAEELFRSIWLKDFKDINESFTKMRGSGLYQGTRWQYRWAVPQYLDIMIETSGGKDVLAKQLNYYYANNLSNQTNEPGLHIPYLYNRLGYPENCQKIVRKILTEEMTHLYGGNAEYPKPVIAKTFTTKKNGFLPEMDEDDGTMCAYYVFGAIGLYPLVIGEPWYEITSPLYDELVIRLTKNKKLTIKAINRKSPQDLIQSVRFNGKEVADFSIDHNELIKGGKLELYY
ncbi:glycoside hydrolase domain-containing protein [Bacteroides sp. 224]|uniref:glycoside hydrolase domain-containing protein n=1 Tax=Bacteroides sp. 224 TaxID=2302936 RepID=UPI0013D30F5F|nr:glycoside hydrolase domain-containing protein [Bacteroides sp. 224]NDV64709.1 glycoside hydrolase family 92 protein [Bacteroides sp. 224]